MTDKELRALAESLRDKWRADGLLVIDFDGEVLSDCYVPSIHSSARCEAVARFIEANDPSAVIARLDRIAELEGLLREARSWLPTDAMLDLADADEDDMEAFADLTARIDAALGRWP